MDGPIGDWGLASQAHEIEAGFLGNRRGFADDADVKSAKRPLPHERRRQLVPSGEAPR